MKFFFGRIFPAIFILVGGAVVGFGVRDLLRASASEDWAHAAGVVRNSEVEYQTDSEGSGTYHAEVLYAYEVDGVQHLGNRVAFGDFGSSDPGHAQKIVNRYPVGTEVTVRHDPDDPALAVLEPGIHGATWMMPAFGSVFLAAGLLMAWFLPRALRRRDEDGIPAAS